MFKLGDVIQHEDNFYIYLAEKNDNYIFYFAKIISDPEIIRSLLKKKDALKPIAGGHQRQNANLILTSLVILTTDDFKDNLAFLGRPDGHSASLLNSPKTIGSINVDDIENIKKEILENTHVFPTSLVNAIKSISE